MAGASTRSLKRAVCREELRDDSIDQRGQFDLGAVRARVERAVLVEIGREAAVDAQAQPALRRLGLLGS